MKKRVTEERKIYQKNYQKKLAQTDSEKERKREWRENNKEYHNEYVKEDRKKHPLHHKARALANKIPIPKGTMCVNCKKELAVERHHKDYDKPLEFELVCLPCHKIFDKICESGRK